MVEAFPPGYLLLKMHTLVRINARSQAWYKSNISTGECSKIDTTTFGLIQIVKEPTHNLNCCPSSLYFST